jgi:hypothetical protein
VVLPANAFRTPLYCFGTAPPPDAVVATGCTTACVTVLPAWLQRHCTASITVLPALLYCLHHCTAGFCSHYTSVVLFKCTAQCHTAGCCMRVSCLLMPPALPLPFSNALKRLPLLCPACVCHTLRCHCGARKPSSCCFLPLQYIPQALPVVPHLLGVILLDLHSSNPRLTPCVCCFSLLLFLAQPFTHLQLLLPALFLLQPWLHGRSRPTLNPFICCCCLLAAGVLQARYVMTQPRSTCVTHTGAHTDPPSAHPLLLLPSSVAYPAGSGPAAAAAAGQRCTGAAKR